MTNESVSDAGVSDPGFQRLKDPEEIDRLRWHQWRQRRKVIHLPVGVTYQELRDLFHLRFTKCLFSEYIPAKAVIGSEPGLNQLRSDITGGLVIVVHWEGWPVVPECQRSPPIFLVSDETFSLDMAEVTVDGKAE